jgi:hypothetical protein
LAWTSANFQTAAHLATLILNIKCAKSVAVPQEVLLETKILSQRAKSGNWQVLSLLWFSPNKANFFWHNLPLSSI